MNLIARCPACQTSFRVVPDQLRISDGWVRCGQCGEVFDASQQLVNAETEHPITASPVPAGELGQALPLTLDAPAFGEPQWASAALLIRPSAESASDGREPSAAPCPSPLAAPVSFMLVPELTSGALQLNRPVLWWGLGVVLLLGLLLQGMYRERDPLATRFPTLKPALQTVCEVLDCRVSPVQGIENLAIDSATFHQVGQDSFVLRFVVKNNARHALALPAIELTLTDLADQPVMRRIFTPAELGVAPETVASSGEWSATAYLRIRTDATGARAQGYRLLIFYP